MFTCLCLSALFTTLGYGLLSRIGGNNTLRPVRSLSLTGVDSFNPMVISPSQFGEFGLAAPNQTFDASVFNNFDTEMLSYILANQ